MTDMDGEALLESLGPERGALRGRLVPMQALKSFTWFRVGGPAELFFSPADTEDLQAFLRLLPEDVPVHVMGLASNSLVRDGGVPGVVVRLAQKGFGQAEVDGNRITAGTAMADKRLAQVARDAELGGFHFYYGIPGTVGGALRMNAGANGVETTERVVSVEAVDRKGRLHELTADEMGFSYRKSNAPADLIFVSATFEGYYDDRATIEKEIEAVDRHRTENQPVKEKTSGSTFKNPPGTSAWKLVDEAGMRGFQVGGAQMSPMHCNFMINTGEATAFDLETLGEAVRQRVYEAHGVLLEWEVARIGRFEPGREVAPFRPS